MSARLCKASNDELENLADGCVLDKSCCIVPVGTFAQIVAELESWRELGKCVIMKNISEQLQAAQRELQMRRNVYPKWVVSGRMKQAKADHEIQCMEAIVATLKALKEQPLEPSQS